MKKMTKTQLADAIFETHMAIRTADETNRADLENKLQRLEDLMNASCRQAASPSALRANPGTRLIDVV